MPTDPFAQLEETVRRQSQEEKAHKVFEKVLARMFTGKDAKSPFFATLGFRKKFYPDWKCETACTNGSDLKYNPDFVTKQDVPKAMGLTAHEIMHGVLKHFARRGARNLDKWNVACDLEENNLLRDAGFQLPDGALFPGEGEFANLPKDATAEKYYELLPDGPGDGGEWGKDYGKCGGVEDAGDKAQQAQAAAEMDVAVVQAAEAAKTRGKLPGALARLVQNVVAPKVDWKDVLREYVGQAARNDYSWGRPNRRYLPMGLYLPSLYSEQLGSVLLAVDTSGSITQKELDDFAAEANGIFETFECSVTIVYHDSKVQNVEHWEPSDGQLKLSPKGGGGTSHTWMTEWVKEHGPPEVTVCFTDMWTRYPDPLPCPTIWCSTTEKREAPFGRTVYVT